MIDSRHSGLPPPIIVSEPDAERLESLLESDEWRAQPAARALQSELLRAEVRPRENMPADVVGMHSLVECEDERSGGRHRLTLVYPNEADVASGRVSVLAPVGSALLGLSVGQHIDWNTADGHRLRLRVLAVQPPGAPGPE
ncbi:nucleoside diphosphate kinase regulator [Luteimonas sp. R10]|uniref:nucleoside diphosphate kinase regulator n=1 Tax=Luteimonas sp. R10 TaxID=3108176 RepID=UPI00308D7B6F|nr:nucleoside diphosphate kinase regulator [Luteimonas sp. R10]